MLRHVRGREGTSRKRLQPRGEGTEAGHRGGAARSSVEGPVMGLERRGCVVRPWPLANRKREEPMDEAKPFKQRLNIGSRVTREGHARFWERPEVKFLRATRQTERDRPRRSTAGQPPTTEVFTDRTTQPISATTAPRALCSTTSTINGTFPDPLHGSQANIAPSPPGRMGPRPTGSALGRGAGPSRQGGLWR